MSDTKTLNLRVDADLKHQAELIFSDLGIPTSTATTLPVPSRAWWAGPGNAAFSTSHRPIPSP